MYLVSGFHSCIIKLKHLISHLCHELIIFIAWLPKTSNVPPVPLYFIIIMATNVMWPYGTAVSGYSTKVNSQLTQVAQLCPHSWERLTRDAHIIS